MDSGLEMHQFVRVSRPFNYNLMCDNKIIDLQYVAPIFPIPLMGEWISEAVNQETEQATPATVVMSYKEIQPGFVRTVDSGLEVHQLVNAKVFEVLD